MTHFDHRLLICPLTRTDAQVLHASLTKWLSEQSPRFTHEFTGQESAGHCEWAKKQLGKVRR